MNFMEGRKMILCQEKKKEKFLIKVLQAFIFSVLSVSVLVWITSIGLTSEIIINDDGKTITITTMKSTLNQVLNENGIVLNEYDYISEPVKSKLRRMKTNKVDIKRAVPVFVTLDGKEKSILTCKATVKEVLDESKVDLGNLDRIEGAELEDSIEKNMKMRIVRVKEEIISEKSCVPYKVVNKENSNLDKGVQKTIIEGKEGTRNRDFKVVFEDGKEVLRSLLKDTLISTPVDKVIEYGTVASFKNSRGEVVRYKKILPNFRATAYTSSYADTGKSSCHPEFGITFTGAKAKRGVVAVDPKVIPLHSRLYIEGIGKTPDYGYAVALDIGGAIKGDIVDLYYDDQYTVNQWGCKRVNIYVLND